MNGEKSIYDETEDNAQVNEPAERLHQAAGSAGEATDEARDWVQDRGAEIKETLQKIANDYSERSLAAVSSKLHHYEHALEAASKALQDDGEQHVADFLHTASDQMKSSASKLENSSPAELLQAAEVQVRKSPWLAVAAAACAGLALSRFVSPRPEGEEEEDNREYSRSY